jgi:hypothetical protein
VVWYDSLRPAAGWLSMHVERLFDTHHGVLGFDIDREDGVYGLHFVHGMILSFLVC